MTDIRVKDLNEVSIPGSDYYLLTDSATDGVKRVKTTNVVRPADIGAASLSGTEALTNKTISGASNTLTNIPNGALTNSGVTISGTTISLGGSKDLTPADLGTMADSSILANTTGGVAAATPTTITAVLDKQFGSMQGSVVYRDFAGWSPLAPGVTGQYLKTQGASSNPMWDTPAGGGDMLKAVYDSGAVNGNAFNGFPVADRTTLKAIDSTKFTVLFLAESGREGQFVWMTGDYSANVTSDPQEGVYIKASAVPSSSGAWVRQYQTGYVMAEWFGAVPWVVGGAQDSTAAFQAAANFAGIGGKWRWAGRHRITSKVTIPDYQSFGSFGNVTSFVPQLVADPAAFTGPNTGPGANKIQNAVFFDGLGTAFELGQASEPNNFLIYGRGYITIDGSKSLNQPSANTADWHGQNAFTYGKYIKPVNVTVEMFQVAFNSAAVGSYSGNYYSTFLNCAAESCCTIFQVQTTPSYNTEIHGGRWFAARFGQFDVGIRNFKVYGGSVEGFSDVTYLRDDSEISFFGTYFETTTPGTLDQFLSTFHVRVIVNFIGCLVYMNNFKTLVGVATTTAGPVLVNSHGNKFVIPAAAVDAAASHVIYATSSATTRAGSLFGDMIVKDSTAKTTVYVDGTTTPYVPYSAAIVTTA